MKTSLKRTASSPSGGPGLDVMSTVETKVREEENGLVLANRVLEFLSKSNPAQATVTQRGKTHLIKFVQD